MIEPSGWWSSTVCRRQAPMSGLGMCVTPLGADVTAFDLTPTPLQTSWRGELSRREAVLRLWRGLGFACLRELGWVLRASFVSERLQWVQRPPIGCGACFGVL